MSRLWFFITALEKGNLCLILFYSSCQQVLLPFKSNLSLIKFSFPVCLFPSLKPLIKTQVTKIHHCDKDPQPEMTDSHA